ncbi:MAG: hypothetical protein WCG80_02985 [Spirochaetales bacterium]
MDKLKTVSFNDQKIVLKNNLVESDILPGAMKDLGRDITVDGETVVQGAIFARNLQVNHGPLKVEGAVFVNKELHVNTDCTGTLTFRKAVGSSEAISCLLAKSRAYFLSDVSGKKITLRNCFVSGSVLADEIDLENCVVAGGAFATKKLSLKNCVLGTFNATSVLVTGVNYLLMPSAFSVEALVNSGKAEFWNLTTLDLSALVFGQANPEGSGKVAMNFESDSLPISLFDAQDNKTMVRSFSIAGKVMMADVLKLEDLENHFILRSATLAGHLEKTYRTSVGELDPVKIADSLFTLLEGKALIPEVKRTVSLDDLRALSV